MTFRMYIIFMSVATLLSWAAWALVMWNMDPTQAGFAGFFMFYLTLFMALIGSLTLLGVLYRVLLLRRRNVLTREVRVAFRHAVLLSVVAIVSLALSGQGLLRWWVILGFVIFMSVLEYLFLIREESRRV